MANKRICTVSHTVPLPLGKFKRFVRGQKYKADEIDHKYSIPAEEKKKSEKAEESAAPKSTESTAKKKKTNKKK